MFQQMDQLKCFEGADKSDRDQSLQAIIERMFYPTRQGSAPGVRALNVQAPRVSEEFRGTFVELGLTMRTEAEFQDELGRLRLKYTPQTYNALRWNCNHFSHDIACFLLGAGTYPSWILNVPHVILACTIGQQMDAAITQLKELKPAASGAQEQEHVVRRLILRHKMGLPDRLLREIAQRERYVAQEPAKRSCIIM
jgi:hypothetical protein